MASGLMVYGVEDLAAALGTLSERVQKNVVQKVMAAAMVPLMQEMRANIRRMTKESNKPGRGRLHRADAIGIKQARGRHAAFGVVGPIYAIAPHAHLIEFGHRIVTGGTASRTTSTGIVKRAKSGTGKGKVGDNTRKFPFASDAFARTAERVKRDLEQRILAGILKEANRRAT